MDAGFSRFEILTTATAFFLCLGFVCVFLEAAGIERALAVSVHEEVSDGLMWAAVEGDGQSVAVYGAADDQAAADAALERAAAVSGVRSVTAKIHVLAGASVCQQALNERLAPGIGFDSGKNEIDEESLAVLEDVANIARQCPAALEVAVHTASRGDAEVNEKHAKRRAQSIAKYLVRAGVDSRKVRALGVGERQPRSMVDEDNERVEIRVVAPEVA